MLRGRRPIRTAIAVILIAGSGCTRSEHGSVEVAVKTIDIIASSTPLPPTTGEVAVIRYEPTALEQVLQGSWQQRNTLSRAESVYRSSCMRDAGFVVPSLPEYHPGPSDTRTLLESLAGAVDLNQATGQGYLQPPEPDNPAYTQPWMPSADEESALYSPGGCEEQTVTAIYGSVDDLMNYEALDQLLEEIVVNVQVEALSDGAVLAGNASWSDCMKAAGYEATDPLSFVGQVWPDPRPTAGEIAAAVADVQCKQSTGYLDALGGTLTRLMVAAENEHDADLRQFLETRDLYLRHAEEALNQAPSD